MEYKVDLERAIVADFVKPCASKRYTKIIYTLTAFSSIALGALVMALFYHWNEIQTIGHQRFEAQDVKEVIRLTDILLTKHDENAANVEKLLTLLQHQQLLAQSATTEASSHLESNLTFKQPKDNSDTNDVNGSVAERKQATVPSSEVEVEHRAQNLTPGDSLSPTQGKGSDEAKQSSESFQWKWSFPQSAWLKLSQHGIDYGTSNDNPVLSNEHE